MDFPSLTEITQVLGGLVALAVVFFIGINFYRKSSDFSKDYDQLIDQYKERNEDLIKEREADREVAERARANCAAEIADLKARIRILERQILSLLSEK